MSSLSRGEVQGKHGTVPAIQRRVKKGDELCRDPKPVPANMQRWCREVGIQVEVLVESVPPCRGGLMHHPFKRQRG
jgi:hypothetical protein